MAIKYFLINIFISLLFRNVALSSSNVAQSIGKQNIIKKLQSDDENSCVYTIYIRTSKTFNAGTDSIISAAFYDKDGYGVLIKDLEAWGGVMGQDYDYYERGNLDVFTGRGPCLDNKRLCSMNLTSDGTGDHHGWYCNYVEVTVTGPHLGCDQQLFTVEQWLALDRSPHELTAIRDNCSEDDNNRLGYRRTAVGPNDVVVNSS